MWTLRSCSIRILLSMSDTFIDFEKFSIIFRRLLRYITLIHIDNTLIYTAATLVTRQKTTLPLGDKPKKDLYTSKFSFLCQSSLIQRSLVLLLNLCRAHRLFCVYCLFNFFCYLSNSHWSNICNLTSFDLEYMNIWESSDLFSYKDESTMGI